MKPLKIDAQAAMRDLKVVARVRVAGLRRLRVRVWLGTHLIKLAGWLIGAGLEIDVVDTAKKTSPHARIVSDGTGPGTVLVVDGDEVHGLTALRWSCDAGTGLAQIEAELGCIPITADGTLRVLVPHPANGELRDISEIHFANGEIWAP